MVISARGPRRLLRPSLALPVRTGGGDQRCQPGVEVIDLGLQCVPAAAERTLQRLPVAAECFSRYGRKVFCLVQVTKAASFRRRMIISSWTASGGRVPSTVNIHSRPA
jgi:hypothetical protein